MRCNEVNKEMPILGCTELAGNLEVYQINITSSVKIYLTNSPVNTTMYALQNSNGEWMRCTLPKGKYKMQLNGTVRAQKTPNGAENSFAFYRLDGSVLTIFSESFRGMTETATGGEETMILSMESDIFDVTGTTVVQLWGSTTGLTGQNYIETPFIWNIFKLQ